MSAAEPGAPTGDRRDRRLWTFAASISMAGDNALLLALAIWAKDLTHSNGRAALAAFAYTAPGVLAPFVGLLADRVRRRPLLVVTDLAMAAWVSLAVLIHGSATAWLVYPILFGLGLAGAVTSSAGGALLAGITRAEDLGRANGALRTAKEAGMLIAPLAGAGLYSLAGGRAVALVDAATFLVAAGCVTAMRWREPDPDPGCPGEPLGRELSAGVVHIVRTPALRHLVGAVGGALLAIGLMEALLYALMEHDLHRPATFIGVIALVQGVVAVPCGLAAGALEERLGVQRLMLLGLLLLAVGSAAPLVPGLLGVLVCAALFGAGAPLAVVALFTGLQRGTPNRLQGRVNAASNLLITAPQVLSTAVGAALIDHVDYRVLLVVMAAGVLLSALWLATRAAPLPAPATAPADAQPDADGHSGQLLVEEAVASVR